ncbi:MAG: DUF4058 family protein [Planctomycetes bacterium]|nr:DUF4058 family protein [Planctomycetota bacterium]
MKSPFPGMDPYIEASRLWGDFHSDLIIKIKDELAPRLTDRYVVRADVRRYVELVHPVDEEREGYQFRPDVAVLATQGGWTGAEHEAVATIAPEDPSAVVMHGLVPIERRETYLDILQIDPERRLITSIEILSPSNKRYGSAGWSLYNRKREAFLKGLANLVEIDLLRQGDRMPMAEKWPISPYYLLAVRKERAPRCVVWPAYYNSPLPALTVPLAPPDADLKVELQPLVEQIYTRSRYDQDIDYRKPLQPPLTAPDAAWLEQRLLERA